MILTCLFRDSFLSRHSSPHYSVPVCESSSTRTSSSTNSRSRLRTLSTSSTWRTTPPRRTRSRLCRRARRRLREGWRTLERSTRTNELEFASSTAVVSSSQQCLSVSQYHHSSLHRTSGCVLTSIEIQGKRRSGWKETSVTR